MKTEREMGKARHFECTRAHWTGLERAHYPCQSHVASLSARTLQLSQSAQRVISGKGFPLVVL